MFLRVWSVKDTLHTIKKLFSNINVTDLSTSTTKCHIRSPRNHSASRQRAARPFRDRSSETRTSSRDMTSKHDTRPWTSHTSRYVTTSSASDPVDSRSFDFVTSYRFRQHRRRTLGIQYGTSNNTVAFHILSSTYEARFPNMTFLEH